MSLQIRLRRAKASQQMHFSIDVDSVQFYLVNRLALPHLKEILTLLSSIGINEQELSQLRHSDCEFDLRSGEIIALPKTLEDSFEREILKSRSVSSQNTNRSLLKSVRPSIEMVLALQSIVSHHQKIRRIMIGEEGTDKAAVVIARLADTLTQFEQEASLTPRDHELLLAFFARTEARLRVAAGISTDQSVQQLGPDVPSPVCPIALTGVSDGPVDRAMLGDDASTEPNLNIISNKQKEKNSFVYTEEKSQERHSYNVDAEQNNKIIRIVEEIAPIQNPLRRGTKAQRTALGRGVETEFGELAHEAIARSPQNHATLTAAAERGFPGVPPRLSKVRSLMHTALGSLSDVFEVPPHKQGAGTAAQTAERSSETVARINTWPYFIENFAGLFGPATIELMRNGSCQDSAIGLELADLPVSKNLIQNPNGAFRFNPDTAFNQLLTDPSNIDDEAGPPRYARAAKNMCNSVASCFMKYSYNEVFPSGTHHVYEDKHLAFIGPAGTGKSVFLNKIIEIKIKTNSAVYHLKGGVNQASGRFVSGEDSNKWTDVGTFDSMINAARADVAKGMTVGIVLDEFTMVTLDQWCQFDVFTQIIAAGDPRQFGSDHENQHGLDFLRRIKAQFVPLSKIWRAENTDLFQLMNYIAYDSIYEIHRPISSLYKTFELAVCASHPAAIALTMIVQALRHCAQKQSVIIGYENSNVMKIIYEVYFADYEFQKITESRIKIVPLSRIQGMEADVLIICPNDVDENIKDITRSLRFLTCIIGRARRTITLILPERAIVAQPDQVMPFSLCLFSCVEEMVVDAGPRP